MVEWSDPCNGGRMEQVEHESGLVTYIWSMRVTEVPVDLVGPGMT